MSRFSLTSEGTWLGLLQQQNTFIFRDQISLVSGDGVSVCLPVPFLLASSSLLRKIYQHNVADQHISLPFVRGETLLLVVDLLRRGATGGIEGLENSGQRLKDVQGVMDLLQTGANVSLKTTKTKAVRDRSRSPCYGDALQIIQASNNRAPVTSVAVSNQNPTARKAANKPVSKEIHNFVSSPQSISTTSTSPNPLFSSPIHLDSSSIKIEPETDIIFKQSTQHEIIDVRSFSLDDNHQEKEFTSSDPCPSKSYELNPPTPSLSCNVCDKLFANKEGKRKHIRARHPEMTFSCHICDLRFILEVTLKKHIEIVHEGIRFSCVQCTSTFSCKKSLSSHIRKKHNIDKQCTRNSVDDLALELQIHEPKIAHNLLQEPKKVKSLVPCSQCSEYFSNKFNMRRHVVLVHEGRRFACEECDYMNTVRGKVLKHCFRSQHDSSRIKTVFLENDA
eukprot:GFUD01034033.1.p1 GENE.GFUD01034033.1~~GFUD01034033.1.p1  ORF type:complete len:448 (-),score=75.17 GFUD01034033.1:10-1353(-)